MKLQFDTIAKTIKIEETVSLVELVEKLEMLLPNGQWKQYKLEIASINNWEFPITIENPIPFTDPQLPFWQQPIITCLHNSSNYTVYNIQV